MNKKHYFTRLYNALPLKLLTNTKKQDGTCPNIYELYPNPNFYGSTLSEHSFFDVKPPAEESNCHTTPSVFRDDGFSPLQLHSRPSVQIEANLFHCLLFGFIHFWWTATVAGGLTGEAWIDSAIEFSSNVSIPRLNILVNCVDVSWDTFNEVV